MIIEKDMKRISECHSLYVDQEFPKTSLKAILTPIISQFLLNFNFSFYFSFYFWYLCRYWFSADNCRNGRSGDSAICGWYVFVAVPSQCIRDGCRWNGHHFPSYIFIYYLSLFFILSINNTHNNVIIINNSLLLW